MHLSSDAARVRVKVTCAFKVPNFASLLEMESVKKKRDEEEEETTTERQVIERRIVSDISELEVIHFTMRMKERERE